MNVTFVCSGFFHKILSVDKTQVFVLNAVCCINYQRIPKEHEIEKYKSIHYVRLEPLH